MHVPISRKCDHLHVTYVVIGGAQLHLRSDTKEQRNIANFKLTHQRKRSTSAPSRLSFSNTPLSLLDLTSSNLQN